MQESTTATFVQWKPSCRAIQDVTYSFSSPLRLRQELSTDRAETATDLKAQPANGDPAGMGDRVFRAEHDAMVLDNERRLLQQTSAALKHIENGTYETCESCTNPICAARLQAFPRATTCLHCRQLADHHH